MVEKIKGISFYRQVGPNCLAASLASILDYNGIHVLPGHLAWELRNRKKIELQQAMDLMNSLVYLIDKWHLKVYPFISYFDEKVRKLIDEEIPLLVVQKREGKSKELHSRILIGYDFNEKEILYLLDPSKKNISMTTKEFNLLGGEEGFSNQNIFILITKRVELPEYFKEVFTNNPFYLNMMGLIRESMGLDCIEEYFLNSIKASPDYADPYNNLALYYMKKNMRKKAEKFAVRAVTLGPNVKEYKETLKEVQNGS